MNVTFLGGTTTISLLSSMSDQETTSPQDSITTARESTWTPGDEAYPFWAVVFDRVQLCFTLAGFLANMLTLMTLAKNHKGFSRLILLLLRHQSLVDCWVCLMATAVILQPTGWLSGSYYLDLFICHAWHGQAFYWGAVTLSTYNLIMISGERYLAICKPFRYSYWACLEKKKVACYFVFLYVFTLFVTHGTYIQTKLGGGECLNEYAFTGVVIEKYFFAFVIFTYMVTYLLPAAIMVIMYALVLRKLSKRGQNKTLGHSNVIDLASTQLTKTAIAVTVIFIVSIGYDLHYYLLGYTGVVKYQLNTPIQKTGVFLSNINSVANPLVYGLLMPLYRRSLIQTFCCCCKKSDPKQHVYTVGSENSMATLSTSTLTISSSKSRHETVESTNIVCYTPKAQEKLK